LTGDDSWEEISFPSLTNGSKMKFKRDVKKRMNDGLEIIGSCLLNQGWVIREELIIPEEEGGLDSCLMLGHPDGDRTAFEFYLVERGERFKPSI